MHWGALKRLLMERGGFPALKGNPIMHTKLVWYVPIVRFLLP